MRAFTLFVVEDDQAVATALAGVAHLMQLAVELHESADDFLRDYDLSQPGCLILDFKLPGMSGIELQSQLNDLGALLPVIMISGHGGGTPGMAIDL